MMTSMNKTFNFSAGPAMLPKSVMQRWQQLVAESPFPCSNISFMEIGHRTPEFQNVVAKLVGNLRELLQVPESYHILLMPGGGRMQFAALAMNLMARSPQGADYFETGLWSQQAIAEAERFGPVHTVASAVSSHYTHIPERADWVLRSDAAYCHMVSNETAHGLAFNKSPKVGEVPLVVDMTSDLLARPLKINDYGLIYAASQKNLGATGFTVVIVREDLLGHAPKTIPSQLDYQTYLTDPTPVTPVTFAIYLAGLITEWVKDQGGLKAMAKHNAVKASMLYDFLDASEHFVASVVPEYRSHTNVVFQLKNPTHTQALVAFTKARGLHGLAGHRVVGGLRASLYNAMPIEGVETLIDCLQCFFDA